MSHLACRHWRADTIKPCEDRQADMALLLGRSIDFLPPPSNAEVSLRICSKFAPAQSTRWPQ